jgi:hypothetical protein
LAVAKETLAKSDKERSANHVAYFKIMMRVAERFEKHIKVLERAEIVSEAIKISGRMVEKLGRGGS